MCSQSGGTFSWRQKRAKEFTGTRVPFGAPTSHSRELQQVHLKSLRLKICSSSWLRLSRKDARWAISSSASFSFGWRNGCALPGPQTSLCANQTCMPGGKGWMCAASTRRVRTGRRATGWSAAHSRASDGHSSKRRCRRPLWRSCCNGSESLDRTRSIRAVWPKSSLRHGRGETACRSTGGRGMGACGRSGQVSRHQSRSSETGAPDHQSVRRSSRPDLIKLEGAQDASASGGATRAPSKVHGHAGGRVVVLKEQAQVLTGTETLATLWSSLPVV